MKPLALCLLLAAGASAANWTDRKEYDLALSVRAELSPQKRLALLDQWKTGYPKSEMQQARRELYLATYQALGDQAHVFTTAAETVAAQPDSQVGTYWYTVLLPEQKAATPEQLALGEKAAAQLLKTPKPPAGSEFLVHRTLGWIHWQRKEWAPAEAEFQKCLELDATAAEISAWYGSVLALQEKPEKRVPALWQLARAASLRDAGALSDGQQRQFGTLLERLYTSYHGDTTGLEAMRASSTASVYPPPNFTIESVATAVLRKQDEDLTRTNPQLAEWVRMRYKLQGPDAEMYFNALKNNALPKMKGTLVKVAPEDKPTEITLGILDPATPEVVIKLTSEFPNAAALGTSIEFEGTADSYAKSPFLLTVMSDPSKITGWPVFVQPTPAPANKKK